MGKVKLTDATVVTLEYYETPLNKYGFLYDSKDWKTAPRKKTTIEVPIPFDYDKRNEIVEVAIEAILKISPEEADYDKKLVQYGVIVNSVQRAYYKIAIYDDSEERKRIPRPPVPKPQLLHKG